jgi:hypothetical protein
MGQEKYVAASTHLASQFMGLMGLMGPIGPMIFSFVGYAHSLGFRLGFMRNS